MRTLNFWRLNESPIRNERPVPDYRATPSRDNLHETYPVDNRGRTEVWFSFDDYESCKKLINDYNGHRLQVDPKDFATVVDEVKQTYSLYKSK